MCPSPRRTVAVTGASGYVGGVIARRLRDDGWHVVALTRSPTSNADEHRTWSLQTRQLPELADIDLLVHAAYDVTPTDWMDIEQVNVGGARTLFDAALDAGVQRLIHISTFRGARSCDGAAKLLAEAEAMSRDGVVIRPGLVSGPRAGAMVAVLQRMTDRLPVIPLIAGDHSPMLPADEQHLADLVAAIADGRELPARAQRQRPEPGDHQHAAVLRRDRSGDHGVPAVPRGRRRDRDLASRGVAVLGSGPAGVACARALLAAGARVTLFDAHARPGSVPSTLPSPAAGGPGTVWGASILPYRDRDLAEWPLGERELAEHYRAVLRFMPLAGEHDALEAILPLYTDEPAYTPLTPQIASLVGDFAKNASKLRQAGIVAGRSRLALQTTANHGPGLARMTADPHFDYRPGQVVERIEEVADHVTLQLRNAGGTPDPQRFERAFVATGVLSSTRLGLMALDAYDQDVDLQDAQHFTAPLLRLPSAPVSTTTSGVTLAEAFLEIDSPEVSANTVHVQIYGSSDLILREAARRLRLAPGLLERHGQSLLGRLMLAQWHLHSNSSDPIRIRLQRDDTLHLERPADDARPRAEARAVARRLLHAFRELRTLVLLRQPHLSEPARGSHLGGTFPMARRPRGLQSDLLGRPGGLERVHLVDGSVLPTIPATTATFSIMANAHRIGHEAAAA